MTKGEPRVLLGVDKAGKTVTAIRLSLLILGVDKPRVLILGGGGLAARWSRSSEVEAERRGGA